MILTVSPRRAVTTAVSVDKYPQTTNILPYPIHMLLENLSVQTHARNAYPASAGMGKNMRTRLRDITVWPYLVVAYQNRCTFYTISLCSAEVFHR